MWSTLMPRTWALSPENLASSASYPGIWFDQTGVHDKGKNASTTLLLPRKELSVISLSRWLGKVKSGAACPTFSFMVLLLLEICCIDPHYTLRFKKSHDYIGSRGQAGILRSSFTRIKIYSVNAESVRIRRVSALLKLQLLVAANKGTWPAFTRA